MDKQFLINEINSLIYTNQLWSEMDDHIFALGGELWETKYAEAYYLYEELVFNLIIQYRGYPSFDDAEFDAFQDTIANLSRNQVTTIHVSIDEEPGYQVVYISNAAELLESHLNGSYPKEIAL